LNPGAPLAAEQAQESAPRLRAVPAQVSPHARSALRQLDLLQAIGRHGAALLLDLDAVEPRGVLAEDPPLHLRGERRIAELLLHRSRDLERHEGVDEPLRRAPPYRVSPPDDVARAERLQQLAEQTGRAVRAVEEGEGERAADLGVHPLAVLLGKAL